MTSSLTTLVIVLGAIAFAHPAWADQASASSADSDRGQAAMLAIQPATINSHANDVIYSTHQLNQVAASISVQQGSKSSSINPLDALQDPITTLNRFLEEQPNQKPKPIHPLAYFEVPALDSGVSVTVSHF